MKTKIKYIILAVSIVALIVLIVVIAYHKRNHGNANIDNTISVIYESGKNHSDAYIEVSSYIMQSAKGHTSKDAIADWNKYY